MSEACVFCDTVSGAPAGIVREDPLTLAFIDRCRSHAGDTLVVPRGHPRDVRDPALTRAVAASFPDAGLSLRHSIGAAADQEVPHPHIRRRPRPE